MSVRMKNNSLLYNIKLKKLKKTSANRERRKPDLIEP